jgi:hypothetical protein
MTSHCTIYFDVASPLAKLFLGLALLVALVETGLALWAKVKALRVSRQVSAPTAIADADSWARFLEALAKLLETLTKLPAWVAIFLAGLALLWIAGQQPEGCKAPALPPATSAV